MIISSSVPPGNLIFAFESEIRKIGLLILLKIYQFLVKSNSKSSDLCKYPRVKHKREKCNPTPQAPKGPYGILEPCGNMPERQRRQENPVAKQCREPGGVCVCVCDGHWTPSQIFSNPIVGNFWESSALNSGSIQLPLVKISQFYDFFLFSFQKYTWTINYYDFQLILI